MRAVFGGSAAGTRKTDGQILSRDGHDPQSTGTPDKIVQRPVTHINSARIRFCDLARMAWPEKTEAHLAHISGVDPRTCRRWLAADNEPPADILGAVLCEIMRRYHQRE